MCSIVRIIASVVIVYAALVPSPVSARAMYLHETERVQIPSPYLRASGVCLEGDHLLVLAVRNIEEEINVIALLHFRREANEWQFVREVVGHPYRLSNILSYEDLACDGPLAAMSTPTGSSFVVELIGETWEATRITGSASHTVVHDNIAAFGTRARGPVTIELARKNPSGIWGLDYVVGNPGDYPRDEYSGPGEFALTADAIAVSSGGYFPPEFPEGLEDELIYDTQVFDRTASGWQRSTLQNLPRVATIGDEVAVLKDVWATFGEPATYFTRDTTGGWTVKHSLLSDESSHVYGARFIGDRVYAPVGPENELAVFVREPGRLYRHRATLNLANPTADAFGSQGAFDVDKDRVAAVSADSKTIYLFTVPATLTSPLRLQETFEGASVADWQSWGKTDWRLSTTGGSRVFRQRNTEGDARAILQTFEGADQSIQADVRVLSLAGSTPWAGFVVRYTDPQNFYYLLVNATSVQIRRIENGVFGPIAKVPFSLIVGRMYQFRLEAVGNRIRAFVNGTMVAEAIDDTHARGRVGLTMWRTSAEYDNVIVTGSPQRELFSDPFPQCCGRQPRWTAVPSNQWTEEWTSMGGVYQQTSASGPARAVNGGPTQDQIVNATVRPVQFNSSGRGFAGVIVRHSNQSNYYYGVLTDDDRVSLRKVVNGVVTVLDEVPYAVATNTSYIVRVEAIGSWIRMYVGGWLMVEREDDSLKIGKYGLVTNDASATFDKFRAVRP